MKEIRSHGFILNNTYKIIAIDVNIHTKEWPSNAPEEVVEDDTENGMTAANHNELRLNQSSETIEIEAPQKSSM